MVKVSLTQAPYANIGHNNRTKLTELATFHIDERIPPVILKDESMKLAYNAVFDAAVKAYNKIQEKQHRLSRKIPRPYHETLLKTGQHPCYEIILQIGKPEDKIPEKTATDILKSVAERFEKEFSFEHHGLYMFGCYIHLDETSPHMHLDYFPYNVTPGKKPNATRNEVLRSMGFHGDKTTYPVELFDDKLKTILAEEAKKYGVEVQIEKNTGTGERVDPKDWTHIQNQKERIALIKEIEELKQQKKKLQEEIWQMRLNNPLPFRFKK